LETTTLRFRGKREKVSARYGLLTSSVIYTLLKYMKHRPNWPPSTSPLMLLTDEQREKKPTPREIMLMLG
jgi:hypothetical protein